jgi:NTE family protein
VLPDEAVDRLRAAAGTIISDSPEFKRLVKDVGGSIIAAPAGATRNSSKD